MVIARKDRLLDCQAKQLKNKDNTIEDLGGRLARISAVGKKSPDDLVTLPDSGSDGSSDDDY
jgi:hypothetical protein